MHCTLFSRMFNAPVGDACVLQRKVQGLTDQQRAATTLAKDRMRARCFLTLMACCCTCMAFSATCSAAALLTLSWKGADYGACGRLWVSGLDCRPEKITIQALDFLGPGVDITDGDLLEDALQKWEPAENTAVGPTCACHVDCRRCKDTLTIMPVQSWQHLCNLSEFRQVWQQGGHTSRSPALACIGVTTLTALRAVLPPGPLSCE